MLRTAPIFVVAAVPVSIRRKGPLRVRVLVCGGREFGDTARAYAVLDRLHKVHRIDVIIEGNARGADRIAGYWARKRGIDNLKFPTDWDAHGKAAGAIRNQQMLDDGKPDLVVAFPGGRGTADMVRRARAALVPIQHEAIASADTDPTGRDTK